MASNNEAYRRLKPSPIVVEVGGEFSSYVVYPHPKLRLVTND